jgi:hypothetical protein
MFRTSWDNYIKFYTVFLTFSVAAMGWLLTSGGVPQRPPTIDHVLAYALIGQSFLTAITSAAIAMYSRAVAQQHARVEDAVLGELPAPTALIGTKAIPVELAIWAGWANAVAMLGMCFAWAYIGFRR